MSRIVLQLTSIEDHRFYDIINVLIDAQVGIGVQNRFIILQLQTRRFSDLVVSRLVITENVMLRRFEWFDDA